MRFVVEREQTISKYRYKIWGCSSDNYSLNSMETINAKKLAMRIIFSMPVFLFLLF